ncbi:hypothetical protein C8D77_1402 [Mesorhizobium loti]|uniref:Uncharacterized protein n=1 Tax=Rhizobium loti TaxID=381 RepID=A0A8E2W592_RHILI|nr:hypothetical protein C8D77_1402 [Mesorhizobium loti]
MRDRDLLQPFDYRPYGKESSIIFGGLQCSKAVSFVILLCVRWYLASHRLLGVKG